MPSPRIPPALLYLTVYNPTLQPSEPVASDDEDAEEQAHILFYTSQERAVSRDRMLRQVGLAKALVNFSEMFDGSGETCDNVHSQSKRMVMISPEPDFWIHAAVEVAKTPRPAVERGKGKGKSKATDKSKAKTKDTDVQPVVYDYHDGSINDAQLRSYILRGYEQFKLTHGSFASILSSLGQQALELQLERFFTVWAWSWSLEDGDKFTDFLGVPLHPLHRNLLPHLDEFSSQIPNNAVAILATPDYYIPSTRFLARRYPTSLPHHISSLIPRRDASPKPSSSEITIKSPPSAESGGGWVPQSQSQSQAPASHKHTESGTFLGIPTPNMNMNMNINVNLDMRKWTWPFGKNPGKKPPDASSQKDVAVEKKSNGVVDGDSSSLRPTNTEVDVDTVSLMEAMESDQIHPSSERAGEQALPEVPPPPPLSKDDTLGPPPSDDVSVDGPSAEETLEADTSSGLEDNVTLDSESHPDSDLPPSPEASIPVAAPSVPPPDFSATTVHLSDDGDAFSTQRRRILYLTDQDLIVAIIENGSTSEDSSELHPFAQKSQLLLDDIRRLLNDESTNADPDTPGLPSATKILQPKDRHVISRNHFTTSSPGFESRSEHLFNGAALLHRDPEISEVYSRGQNPQHWHVSRRGLGVDASTGDTLDGEVYMEVSRKETTLTDVENVLAGVVRRFTS